MANHGETRMLINLLCGHCCREELQYVDEGNGEDSVQGYGVQ